jgi:hypothetical protein
MFFSTKQAFIIPGRCIAVQADKSHNVMYITAMTGLREIAIFFRKHKLKLKQVV